MFNQILNSTEYLLNNYNINNNAKCDNKSIDDNAIHVEMNDNNKRLGDEWGNDWSKRVCNSQHNYSIAGNDDNSASNESQELYGISCLMSNFRLNYTECPEWPTDWLNECCNNNTVSLQITNSLSNTDEYNGIFPPMVGEVYYRFKLENCLKRDKRCAVFEACDNSNAAEKFVVKIGIAKGSKILRREYDSYKLIAEKSGSTSLVPKLVDGLPFYAWKVVRNGVSNEWSILVMEKLGADLSQLMPISPNCNQLPYDLLANYAIQMITCLETIHACGLLHRKVKPKHFVISGRDLHESNCDAKQRKICVISFGAAKSYLNESMAHIAYQSDKKLPKGDPLFHSINYFDGVRRTRRDDMESLGYCLVYLIKGNLPWSNNIGTTLSSSKHIRAVGTRMRQTSLEELCDKMPQILNYFRAISDLNFEDKPDYDLLRHCFDTSIHNQF